MTTQLSHSESQVVEKQFDLLYEELKELIAAFQDNHSHIGSGKVLNVNSLSEKLEKLFTEFEIQQEYSLSNLKESIFQIQHGNDQVKLDLKKIGLDLNQLSKKVIEGEQYMIESAQNQSSLAGIEFVTDINTINSGFTQLHKRIQRNEKSFAQIHIHHSET